MSVPFVSVVSKMDDVRRLSFGLVSPVSCVPDHVSFMSSFLRVIIISLFSNLGFNKSIVLTGKVKNSTFCVEGF